MFRRNGENATSSQCVGRRERTGERAPTALVLLGCAAAFGMPKRKASASLSTVEELSEVLSEEQKENVAKLIDMGMDENISLEAVLKTSTLEEASEFCVDEDFAARQRKAFEGAQAFDHKRDGLRSAGASTAAQLVPAGCSVPTSLPGTSTDSPQPPLQPLPAQPTGLPQ